MCTGSFASRKYVSNVKRCNLQINELDCTIILYVFVKSAILIIIMRKIKRN